jgi:hypothetical protein
MCNIQERDVPRFVVSLNYHFNNPNIKTSFIGLSTWELKLLGMVHCMMKSMNLTMGNALYLYTICPILSDSSDFFLCKESLFL